MKKWLVVLCSVCLVMTASAYIFIPGTLIISKIVTFSNPRNVTNRFLLNEKKWHRWWPNQGSSTASGTDSTFSFNGYTYYLKEFFTDKVNVMTIKDNDSLSTSINMLPVDNYSVTIRWEGSLQTAVNPVKRVSQYFKGVRIKQNMTAIFDSLQSFLQKTTNVYGFPIEEIISKDSTLIATKYLSKTYPGTREIYSLVDSVKNYIARQGGVETDHPMLRVSRLNDSSYQTMVAIPTNKALPGNNLLFFLRFVPYKTLVGTVRGGPGMIEKGFKQMEIFVDDHQRTSMAVPFQSLVTDRSKQTDSLQWVTVICQPVS